MKNRRNRTATHKGAAKASARNLSPASAKFERIVLPPPTLFGGNVAAALKKRRTVRSFSDKKLSRRTLSNLLWSACGVNRKSGPFGVPGITAGSASNSQEIDLYAALEEGIYLYEAGSHSLRPVAAGDMRRLALGERQEPTGSNAAVRLIFVADIEKYKKADFQEPGLWDAEVQKSYYYVDAGLIAGNLYLFAASQGLGAWFHNCNRSELALRLGLGSNQRVLFGQTIGYAQKD
ncbi:MAG TPA: SagB/ThcOx family dehydrogenase [Spirochaetia bacterium]|nr:SagB/ThcOx family dehydrogenase [Spirochaetia bacterium]